MYGNVSIERLATILAIMYDQRAELVVDIGRNECYLFLNRKEKTLEVEDEEVNFLIHYDIVDLDSGCDQEGHETKVFVLTDHSRAHLKRIVDDIRNKRLKLQ